MINVVIKKSKLKEPKIYKSEDSKYETIPAYKDPSYYLLAEYKKKEKIKILNIRRRKGVTIEHAIEVYRLEKIEISKEKKQRRDLKKRLEIKALQSRNQTRKDVRESLTGITSSRGWNITK
ncbi:hypothetical protein [Photobacterium kagoshimensis]|uniref:hypothetical protein n=1 Tax=Photobacterium kagoshimensis TaxID=2910242 RepID=UPI003D1506CA